MLGTEANVRVLRVLTELDGPISPAELARRAVLQVSGIRRVLNALAETGIIEFVGAGARQHARIREEHPLAASLRMLFAAEAGRVQTIIDAIRQAASQLRPPPAAVWIEGPVATERDRFSDPVVVGVLADGHVLSTIIETLRERLASTERMQDVTIELRGLTRADIQASSASVRNELRAAVPLFGIPPAAFFPDTATTWGQDPVVRSHEDLDARALALAVAVGKKLSRDPALRRQAKQTVVRLLANTSEHERSDLREWLHILDTMSGPRLRDFLADTGERATRLRQSLPFAGILTPDERAALLGATPSAEPRPRRKPGKRDT